MWTLFKVGDRVRSFPEPPQPFDGTMFAEPRYDLRGTVTRVRLHRRGKDLQNVDVLLDKDCDDPCAGKIIGSINSCWVHESAWVSIKQSYET